MQKVHIKIDQYGEKVDQKAAKYVPGRESSRRVQESSRAIDSMEDVIYCTALLYIVRMNEMGFTESVKYRPP